MTLFGGMLAAATTRGKRLPNGAHRERTGGFFLRSGHRTFIRASRPSHPSFGCLLGSLAILHELSLFLGCSLAFSFSYFLFLSFSFFPLPWSHERAVVLRGTPLTRDHPVQPTGIPVYHVTCHATPRDLPKSRFKDFLSLVRYTLDRLKIFYSIDRSMLRG